MKYADVVVGTKSDNVDNFFTYETGGLPGLRVGSKVTVPFAQERAKRTGYVFALFDELPEGLAGKRIRCIEGVDEGESISEEAVAVCRWMRRRCYCRYIDAAKCFAPAGKKAAEAKGGEGEPCAPGSSGRCAAGGSGSAAAFCPSASRTIPDSLLPANPKLASLRQSDLRTAEGCGIVAAQPNAKGGCATAAASDASAAAARGADQGGFSGGCATAAALDVSGTELTVEQRAAVSRILPAMEAGVSKVFLLRGVTGSGKTEVYLAAAERAAQLGKRTIMLVPEISLTHQTVERFLARFGAGRIAVLHSGLTLRERYDEWVRIKGGAVDVVIGARSAVFAPVSDIGAILVDEEHEGTYKSDMSPKYDAVEVAVKRAQAAGAVCVLGSATPSVVSSYRAEQGYYELITLAKRYNTTPLPHLTVVDMRKELLAGNKSIFSEALFAAMYDALAAGKQVMLFLNRRGWSSFVSCPHCGYVMKCARCNISLTYHKAEDRAVCHFCGQSLPVPADCPSCGAEGLRFFGLGTEQVEALTKQAFPGRTVARLDVDAAKPKGAAKKILKDFGAGKTDILIGTQMIAKGLDFAGVAVVGVISADITLNIPDFKSPERTYQLITQVAGRAGRREERGSVFVQTYVPDNYAIEAARNHDYEGFYRSELYFRETLSYPPFTDVVQITSFAATEDACAAGAEEVRREILAALGQQEAGRMLGPRPAPIARAGNDFRYHLYLKAPTARRRIYEAAFSDIKRKINTDAGKDYRIIIDVNPFSLM
ncbi:MAG: primosomal protein N' [Clostridiales Family XIII bacterium]|jgi:primosomal protein N' (replication factor Y)|nr:primosomal protein N' [Clostridiales Family XIII bacterium]